jgi:mannosyltransferase OCH1-like enzyme
MKYKKNPDYKYYLFDDLDIDNYVKNNYDNETYNNFNKLKVPTAKANFWR